MSEWEAPAKLNLDLRVRPAGRDGLHPIRSLTQAIDWCDIVRVEEGDEDHLEVSGVAAGEVPEGSDNLIWKAVAALELVTRPRLAVFLEKHIPTGAGLGGGSSDAAAMLAALGDMLGVDPAGAASAVGADVTFFLTGGTAVMEGHGEQVTPVEEISGVAVAVAVPDFVLSTAEVYRKWDDLGEPAGETVEGRRLPPPLRHLGEVGNDLTPAALSLRPELGDWIADLEDRWERTVHMTGSGPACFAYFADLDEAIDAADEVPDARAAMAAPLRRRGVSRRE